MELSIREGEHIADAGAEDGQGKPWPATVGYAEQVALLRPMPGSLDPAGVVPFSVANFGSIRDGH